MGEKNPSKREPGRFPDLERGIDSGESGCYLIWGVLAAAILAGLLVPQAMAAPVLVLSPSSGQDGTWVTATGSAFNVAGLEFAQARILFNGVVVAQNVWFTGSGFSTSFQVPIGTPWGTYTVQAVGPRDSATTPFTVAYPPVADFTINPASGMIEIPQTVFFIDRSTGNPTSWWWSFGDGSSSSAQNPGHQYPNPATYTVTLTVNNAAGSSSTSRTVTAYKPALVLSPSSGKPGTQVTATGSSFNLYSIEFPQATVSFNGIIIARNVPMTRSGTLGSFTTSFPVPAGTAPGSYSVRVVGPLNSVDTVFTVTNTEPQAIIDANPLSGRTPLPVHFSGTRSYDEDGSINSYRWNFDDGATATGAIVDHTYTRSGEYRATLTVTDNQGGSGTAYVLIKLENIPPIAVARGSPTSGPAPLTVSFDAAQSSDPDGRIVSYHWDFGDGYWERTAKASHQYKTMESFTAVLTVTDDKGMTGKDEVLITVGNDPPVASIRISPQKGSVPLRVMFDGSQSYDPEGNDLTFSWDFGDGASGSGMTAEHTYGNEGIYQVSLQVTDSHGASDRAEGTVEVEQPFPLWPVVIGGLCGGIVIEEFLRRRPRNYHPGDRLPEKFNCPKPPVHVDVRSGVECLHGKEREAPDITVDIRSGIWKEGDEQ